VWHLRKESIFNPVCAFLAAYFGMLLVWPFTDVRFLFPVAPILFHVLHATLRERLGRAASVYAVIFTMLGVGYLGYSDALSISRGFFLDRYGDGSLTNSYRVAYGLDPRPDLPAPIAYDVDLLRYFDVHLESIPRSHR
jgi:hypothetical protein